MRAKQRLIGVLVLLLLGAGRTGWLWLNPQPISGAISQNRRRVTVEGPLTSYADKGQGRYGVVTDEHGIRVAIRHLGGRAAKPGHRVLAIGRLEFDPDFGHYLQGAVLCPVGDGDLWRAHCDFREVVALL